MWTGYFFQTTTGALGPKVKFASSSWSIPLNDIESISLKLKKSDLPVSDLNRWLEPWWSGVVLLWNGFPIVGGPITTVPSETRTDISINCQGIRSILARRLVLNELVDWNDTARSTVTFSGMSLGTIAQRVVQLAQQKPGGTLPIAYPYPYETSNNERNYQGFNLANIFANDVLSKLSGVIDGPDIMFRPRLVGDSAIVFDMLRGNKTNPRIPQTYSPVWDTTSSGGQVVSMSIARSGVEESFRVFATGAGQDEGTLIKMAQELTPTAEGYPLLESVESFSSVETPEVLQEHADASIKENITEMIEISLEVRADGTFPLGTFFTGDKIEIHTKGWQAIPDGLLRARIVSLSGSNSNVVKVALQLED